MDSPGGSNQVVSGDREDTASHVEVYVRAARRDSLERHRRRVRSLLAAADWALDQWGAWHRWRALPPYERAGVAEPLRPISPSAIARAVRALLVEELARVGDVPATPGGDQSG